MIGCKQFMGLFAIADIADIPKPRNTLTRTPGGDLKYASGLRNPQRITLPTPVVSQGQSQRIIVCINARIPEWRKRRGAPIVFGIC